MGNLERDTRLEALDGPVSRYRASVGRAWEAAPGRPAGGFLAALALRAAGEVSDLPRPVSFSGHFVQPARFGELEIGVSTLSRGKRTAALRVSMTQSEAPILDGLVWTAADEMPGYAVEFAPIPEHPGPEGLFSVTAAAEEAGRPLAPCWKGIEFRSRWREPGEDGAPREPLARSWHRFHPQSNFADRFVDAARLVFLIEATAMSPLLFYAGGCISKVPYVAACLDLSVQFHHDARKADWVMLEGRVPSASAGIAAAQNRFWSPDGTLLASAQSSLLCRENRLAPGTAS